MRSLAEERESTLRSVRRTMSASLLSDTKWRKIFAVLKRPDLGVTEIWFKFVDVDEEKPTHMGAIGLYPPHPFIDTFDFGPVEFVAIEWLRIPLTPAENAVNALKEVGKLKLVGQADSVRIIGHEKYA